MNKTNFRTVSMLAICFALAACGGGSGGGVNSMPTPVPAPPAPPPPPPPPPPSATNENLINLVASQSFTNDAAAVSGTYSTDGQLPANLARTGLPLNVSYDVATLSYTVAVQGRTQTFRPQDRLAAESTAEQTTYERVTGTTTDSLTLTNAGTSGRYRYTYVGGGFWQRQVQTGTTINGTFDAFAYGLGSPGSAVPTSGAAAYDFDLLGVVGAANAPAPNGLNGSGRLLIDFDAARLTVSGTATEVDGISGTPIGTNALTGSADIAGGNGFTGVLTYDRFGVPYVGNLAGRFYGPAAQEIGAAVHGTSQGQGFGQGGVFAAALIGRKDPNGPGVNQSLLRLVADQSFVTQSARVTTEVDPASGLARSYSQQEPTQFTGSGSIGPGFRYINSSTSYSVTDSTPQLGQIGGTDTIFGPGQLLATQPDSRFTEYRTTNSTSGTVLRLYRPGGGNTQIALSYASFGIFDQTSTPDSNGRNRVDRLYFTYGIPSTAFPRSGSASFTGAIHGRAGSTTLANSPGSDLFDVGGAFAFNFDFAADSLSGTFSPTGTNIRTGAALAFGTYNVSNGRGPQSTGGGFDGSLSLAGAGVTGAFKGRFFGPLANELAGTFVIREPIDNNTQFLGISGAFVGRGN